MTKKIHIIINQKGYGKLVKDSIPTEHEYMAWAEYKGIKDPKSRISFKKFISEKGISPVIEKQLEKKLAIGTSDSYYRVEWNEASNALYSARQLVNDIYTSTVKNDNDLKIADVDRAIQLLQKVKSSAKKYD